MARLVRTAAASIAMSWALVVITGCGGSSSSSSADSQVDRNAAAAGSNCPNQRDTKDMYLVVVNRTSSPISLQVPDSSWSCTGWSGPSNPGGLDGVSVTPGSTATKRLETKNLFSAYGPGGAYGDPGGPKVSEPYQLGIRTPSGASGTPITFGSTTLLQIEISDGEWKAKLAGQGSNSLSANGSATGTADGGRRVAVEWRGTSDRMTLTLTGS